ncbi:Type VI secretion system VasI, EvfG, VC_A0118 [Rhodospirillales bacterium URHD0017]|nr:Type VI secretion system VasI, EvfG, VC_A0118 [Rhodospirillales bacterium URHD0017]
MRRIIDLALALMGLATVGALHTADAPAKSPELHAYPGGASDKAGPTYLPSLDPGRATWLPVEARNHVTGASGPAAVLLGVAQEKGRPRQASLRILCFDGATTVHTDAEGLHPGPWAVSVKVSLDGGRFVDGFWQPSAGGSSLELSGNRAIAFLANLYGKAELRLAVVRPLSVPFLITFAVSGAEPSLRPLAERCQWSAGPALSEAGR